MGRKKTLVGINNHAAVAEIRAEAGAQKISMRELARRANIPYQTFLKLAGNTTALSYEQFATIATVLGLEPAELAARATSRARFPGFIMQYHRTIQAEDESVPSVEEFDQMAAHRSPEAHIRHALRDIGEETQLPPGWDDTTA